MQFFDSLASICHCVSQLSVQTNIAKFALLCSLVPSRCFGITIDGGVFENQVVLSESFSITGGEFRDGVRARGDMDAVIDGGVFDRKTDTACLALSDGVRAELYDGVFRKGISFNISEAKILRGEFLQTGSQGIQCNICTLDIEGGMFSTSIQWNLGTGKITGGTFRSPIGTNGEDSSLEIYDGEFHSSVGAAGGSLEIFDGLFESSASWQHVAANGSTAFLGVHDGTFELPLQLNGGANGKFSSGMFMSEISANGSSLEIEGGEYHGSIYANGMSSRLIIQDGEFMSELNSSNGQISIMNGTLFGGLSTFSGMAEILGGYIEGLIQIRHIDGSLTIHNGEVSGQFSNKGSLTIAGGSVDGELTNDSGLTSILGGNFAGLISGIDGRVEIHGSHFSLNGQRVQQGAVSNGYLTGRLRNGGFIEAQISANELLQVVLIVPEPASVVLTIIALSVGLFLFRAANSHLLRR